MLLSDGVHISLDTDRFRLPTKFDEPEFGDEVLESLLKTISEFQRDQIAGIDLLETE